MGSQFLLHFSTQIFDKNGDFSKKKFFSEILKTQKISKIDRNID